MQTCCRKSKQVTEIRNDSGEAFEDRALVTHEEMRLRYLYIIVEMDRCEELAASYHVRDKF